MKKCLCRVLPVFLVLSLLTGCGRRKPGAQTVGADTLVVSSANFDGKFSPFFYTNVYEGEVLELMNYYSSDVKLAYHEKLLGTKLADAPDDAEMLDIIWASQVSDVGLICCNCDPSMDTLVYMLPSLVVSGKNTFSSFVDKYSRSAQRGLDRVFKQS